MTGRWIMAASAALALGAATPALAQDTKVSIGISGWTGFAPLTLAKEAGIFKKNGLDVTIKKIRRRDRQLAIAPATSSAPRPRSRTYIVWNANGVPYQAALPAR